MKEKVEIHRRRLPALSVHQEMHLRATARKEAFDILRANSPDQRSRLLLGSGQNSLLGGYSSSTFSTLHNHSGVKLYKGKETAVTANDSLSSCSAEPFINPIKYLRSESSYDPLDQDRGLRVSFSAPTSFLPFEQDNAMSRVNSMPFLKD